MVAGSPQGLSRQSVEWSSPGNARPDLLAVGGEDDGSQALLARTAQTNTVEREIR
jgi:hypothetical protein